MSIGERIKIIRGKTPQKMFASTIGVAQNTLGNYERNERTPNADVIVAIADTYGVSFDWLLTGNGEKKGEQKAEKDLVRETSKDYEATNRHKDQLEELQQEIKELRQDNRELRQDNRELRQENRELRQQARYAEPLTGKLKITTYGPNGDINEEVVDAPKVSDD
ncbi:helix-turn-helix domain-containing protein [Desulfovibrio sp. JC010]|uniref:helix-turn-helix domain-containing protein n=1 Tax=Desulfovibrio sp. JC010 TaxID=2593641 RepID=UPI0013D1F5FD|nr:helix-turn-helix domain-containing protein [Desulfovibrio sp. JC010]NDV27752.1 helix-turn-helix domain-containing protein [Desulfovibrio sp. JC010]